MSGTIPHILDILCQYGYFDTAWRVLLQKECPSWLYEVEKGATTCFRRNMLAHLNGQKEVITVAMEELN